MSLFDQTLGHKLSLLKIYTPLPVDFAIHGQQDKKGRFDWWCGRRGEDRPARGNRRFATQPDDRVGAAA